MAGNAHASVYESGGQLTDEGCSVAVANASVYRATHADCARLLTQDDATLLCAPSLLTQDDATSATPVLCGALPSRVSVCEHASQLKVLAPVVHTRECC